MGRGEYLVFRLVRVIGYSEPRLAKLRHCPARKERIFYLNRRNITSLNVKEFALSYEEQKGGTAKGEGKSVRYYYCRLDFSFGTSQNFYF